MVSWEDHSFRDNLTGLLIFFYFQMQILLKDFQQSVLIQHILPEIFGIVPVRINRIPGTAHTTGTIAALIERQEIRPVAFQSCGHINPRQINSKMNQDTLLKCKDSILGSSVKFILLDGIGSILSGELTLQLH